MGTGRSPTLRWPTASTGRWLTVPTSSTSASGARPTTPRSGRPWRDAVAADVVVVAAAGNSGVTTRFYPAALPNVLAVGATTVGGGSRASFSQYGSWVDVGAPGIKIIGANKSYATAADYVVGDGTSFASPLVAGIAALVRASRPELGQAAVRSTITATASPRTYGFAGGLVDAYAALGHELVLPGPSVSQPAPGATVSGTVAVVVDAGAVDASHVRARLVGGGPTVTAPLVAGRGDTRCCPPTGLQERRRCPWCSAGRPSAPQREPSAARRRQPGAGDHLACRRDPGLERLHPHRRLPPARRCDSSPTVAPRSAPTRSRRSPSTWP